LARLPLDHSSIDELIPQDALRYAQIYSYMKNIEMSERYYDKARSILEAKVEEDPNNAFFHAKLGVAFASLGRKEDAIQSGKKGLELLQNLNTARDMAQIYMVVEEFDAAVDQIEYMLSFPGGLSIPLLKIDPLWDPLREHPCFKKLIEPNK
jgi:tetratricopeptide (TPR) repeat protein